MDSSSTLNLLAADAHLVSYLYKNCSCTLNQIQKFRHQCPVKLILRDHIWYWWFSEEDQNDENQSIVSQIYLLISQALLDDEVDPILLEEVHEKGDFDGLDQILKHYRQMGEWSRSTKRCELKPSEL
jgi:hypothetical protein